MPGSNRDKLHEYAGKLEDLKADLSRVMEDIRAGVNTLVQQAQDNAAHQPEDLSASFAEFDQVLSDFGDVSTGLRGVAATAKSGPTAGGGTGASPQTPPAGSQADASDASVTSGGSGGGAGGEGIVVGGDRPAGSQGVVVSDGAATSDAGDAGEAPPSGGTPKP